MNPLFFLFALLGAGGLSSGGSGRSAETTTVKFTSTLPDAPAEPEEDATEDTPPAPPAPQVEIADETPDAPEQSGDGGSGAGTDPITADGTVEVMTGRVTTLAPSGDDIASVRIVDGVDHGTVTVNPDGSFALVLTQTDFVGSQSFTYEATHSDGATTLHEIGLDVVPGAQAGGWGTGESHYMLATDADDRIIVEHGDVHTKVYISGDSSALSLAKIADIEDMAVEDVTGAWLASHGGYGQSEGMALAEDAGMALWNAVTPRYSETSNWLLLESGHEYGDLGRILNRGTQGEDELKPVYVGAWGEGSKPVVTTIFKQFQEGSENLVVQGIEFTGGIEFLASSSNVIFDDISVSSMEMVVQYSDGITIRNSDLTDVYHESSLNGGDWDAHGDRAQGLYANLVDGLLLEGNFFAQNGWAEGYDAQGDGASAQPPSMFSHNIYLGTDITDLTLRDTISMQAASYGAQIRSGAYVEDSVFIDNNAAFITLGGDYDGAGPIGQYSLVTDNVITSGAHKEADVIGAYTLGLADDAQLSSLVDNIVTHLADPNNPEEYQERHWINDGLRSNDAYYDDTIVYNWLGSYADRFPETFADADINTEGLDTAVLDQTTIQLFTAQLLGKSDATISDLADYLRAQSDGAFDDLVDADLIIAFFQDGFGLTPDLRGDATTLRFVPNDLGEGVRWDNRLNWDTEDLPGTQDGDSVDLGGNHVVFGTNATIDEIALSDGALSVYGGRLEAAGGITDGGHLNVEGAGQAWIGGHTGDTLDIDVSGGRFANTGTMGNTDLDVTGGQAIMATGGAEYDVTSGRTLAIFDAAAKVGFDGDDGGMAILDMEEGAELILGSSEGEMASIEEFRSGAFGDAPNVQSGIDLGGATLKLDLSGLSASQAGSFTLMDADEIVGLVDAATLEIGGLGGRDANIVIDYVTDSVTLELIEGGSGAIDISTVGDERQSDHDALWMALTADQGLAENQPLPEEEELLDVA